MKSKISFVTNCIATIKPRLRRTLHRSAILSKAWQFILSLWTDRTLVRLVILFGGPSPTLPGGKGHQRTKPICLSSYSYTIKPCAPVASPNGGSRKGALFCALMILHFTSTNAQQATWIWYPGDYEI